VLGPGSLYTSIIPNLLVDGISAAIFASSALKIFVLNIMTQLGETEGYTASDHVSAIFSIPPPPSLPTAWPTRPDPAGSEGTLPRGAYGQTPVDPEDLKRLGVELIERPMISEHSLFARHNHFCLARELLSIYDNRSGSQTDEFTAACALPDADLS
jgi:uncharacterized cofD-like protein